MPPHAVTIELKDVAADRVERQRAAAIGSLPLPGTPDLASFDKRLAAKGLKAGNPVFIRIFKAESELEVWMRNGDRFVLLDTYPVCHWSGTIGPKLHEGDKQTPEGFYEVTRKQLHLIGRHPRSLNLGFPNSFDKVNQRTGSYILVHGGCSSVGCFAMTNSVVAEIYDLTEQAIKAGQERVQVHVFPFRMTDDNLAKYRESEWYPFWQNLKEGHDAFLQTRMPPQIGVCDKRYSVQALGPEEVTGPGPLAVCGESLAALSEWEGLGRAAQLQVSRLQLLRHWPTASQSKSRRYPYPRLARQSTSPRVRQPAERDGGERAGKRPTAESGRHRASHRSDEDAGEVEVSAPRPSSRRRAICVWRAAGSGAICKRRWQLSTRPSARASQPLGLGDGRRRGSDSLTAIGGEPCVARATNVRPTSHSDRRRLRCVRRPGGRAAGARG